MCGTWEPVVPMLREKSKWQTHKDLSTDAEHRGGAIRSSDEGSVMELERRGCVVLLLHKNNPKGEDSVGRMNDRGRMSREVHVRFWESLRGRFPWATRLGGSPCEGRSYPDRFFFFFHNKLE